MINQKHLAQIQTGYPLASFFSVGLQQFLPVQILFGSKHFLLTLSH